MLRTVGAVPVLLGASVLVVSLAVPALSQTTRSSRDPGALREEARIAQARFERLRRLNLSHSLGGRGGACDEVVGRMCLWHAGDDDWTPPPERPEVVVARDELLATLASAAWHLPDDDWILGQRVRYLIEAGRPREALALARKCSGPSRWWCQALLGYVLHREHRFVEAEGAFQGALRHMPADEARRWEDLTLILDSRGAGLAQEAFGESAMRLRHRAWTLADPFFLVPGNDRLTEHYARWVVALLREDSQTPYRLVWGSDFWELLIRYGAETGWERVIHPAGGAGSNSVVGHHPRGARAFMPPGVVLEAPGSASSLDWPLEPARPRSSYSPPYAPAMEELEAEVARFFRPPRALVVAAYRFDGGGEVESANSLEAGLFLVPESGGELMERRHRGRPRDGALVLDASPGQYLLSLEVLDRARRRAARTRRGVSLAIPAEGLVALSDLLLLESRGHLPGDLSEAVRGARTASDFHRGEEIRFGWEAYGLRPRGEAVTFRVTVEDHTRGFFSRVGGWLGLGSDDPDLTVEWTESGPEAMGPYFRALDLALTELDPGDYRIVVRMSVPGRSDVTTERNITIRE